MNIDVYQGKWLRPDYSLLSLSRLIKSACDISSFDQLVQDITRIQFNSVSNVTKISCIDHIYTNTKFRCSAATVISFGDSDKLYTIFQEPTNTIKNCCEAQLQEI